MINRALCPISKSGIEKWYSHSILSHIMPAAKGQLSCQRFWDNMESWTAEDEIPLFYEIYEGNRPDSVQFKETVSRLSGRYRKVFGKEPDITLIFDRGNNLEENIRLLKGDEDHLNFHYVGGLKQNPMP